MHTRYYSHKRNTSSAIMFLYHEGTDPNCTDHSVYPSSTIGIGMTSVEKQARCLPVEKQASKLSRDKQL